MFFACRPDILLIILFYCTCAVDLFNFPATAIVFFLYFPECICPFLASPPTPFAIYLLSCWLISVVKLPSLFYAFCSCSTTLRIRSVVCWGKAFAIAISRFCCSGIIILFFSLKATETVALRHFLSIVCAIFF